LSESTLFIVVVPSTPFSFGVLVLLLCGPKFFKFF
jgi:hypothetical protein